MSAGYENAIKAAAKADEDFNPRICFDPFHVVALGSRAVDQVRRDEWNAHGRSHTPTGTWIKGARWSLLKDPAKQTVRQLARLHEIQQTNKRMYRAFLLLFELRWLYRIPPAQAREHLEAWLAWASRSKLRPFVKLARTIRKHRSGVLAAIDLGLSNGRLEGLHSKVRLLSHRAYGFHSHDGSSSFRVGRAPGPRRNLPARDGRRRERRSAVRDRQSIDGLGWIEAHSGPAPHRCWRFERIAGTRTAPTRKTGRPARLASSSLVARSVDRGPFGLDRTDPPRLRRSRHDALIATIYLCCGGITIALPQR